MKDIKERIVAKYFWFKEKRKGSRILKKIENYELKYGLYTGKERKEKIVVSVASYAGRYSVLPMMLKSLLCQSVKPDKIIVWLDENINGNQISEELLHLCQFGIEFRHTNDNLKPHKKYLYSMREFPDANIITVDDDLIYSEDMIESLIKYHEKYPDCVCARRVHKMTFNGVGELEPYIKWKYEYRGEKEPSFVLCATGGGGTLYPPHVLPEEALNIGLIKELSLEADDIWLKFMELKNKVKVVWVKNDYVMPRELKDSQMTALNTSNVHEGKNDIFVKKILGKYPEVYQFLRGHKYD